MIFYLVRNTIVPTVVYIAAISALQLNVDYRRTRRTPNAFTHTPTSQTLKEHLIFRSQIFSGVRYFTSHCFYLDTFMCILGSLASSSDLVGATWR